MDQTTRSELDEVRRSDRSRSATALGVAAIYVAFSVLLPLHRFNFDRISSAVQLLLVLVPTALFMFLQLALVQSLIRLRLNLIPSIAAGLIGLIVWFGMLMFFHPVLLFGPQHYLLAALSKSAIMGLALTLALSFFGALISLIVKEKNMLLPVAVIAMPIDFLGAMTSSGFTHDMVKHAPKFVSSVSVSVPAVTSETSHGISIGPIAIIGPGDILFMALFLTAVQRFDLAKRGTFWWMYGLLTLSMLLVIKLPDFLVGALVPMGLAVIVANAKLIKLKRDEIFAVAYAGALILVLVGFFFWSSHRYVFHSH